MNITVFAKKGTNKETGKQYFRFITKMTRKDGKVITANVKFRDDCKPLASDCPMNIVVDKEDANMAVQEVIKENTGEVRIYYTLWVSAWVEGAPYEDHSRDDCD